MSPIRVLIADDHPVVLQGLRSLLRDAPDLDLVAEATSGTEAVSKVVALRPDVAILDIKMPGMTGIEALREIRRRSPETYAIILSMYRSEHYMRSAFLAGASAYLTKDSDLGNFGDVVREVSRGNVHLPRGTRLDDLMSGPTLTPREMQVLMLIARGLTSKEIAQELGIDYRTVDAHRSSTMKKLKVHNATALVRVAYEWGLVEPD